MFYILVQRVKDIGRYFQLEEGKRGDKVLSFFFGFVYREQRIELSFEGVLVVSKSFRMFNFKGWKV